MSRHKGGRLLSSGEVDSLMIMGRRHIDWQSFLNYLERQRTGKPRDPVERERAAREYRASAAQTLLRQGRNLVRGSAKGRPNRKPETLGIGRRVSQPDKHDLFEENPQSQ